MEEIRERIHKMKQERRKALARLSFTEKLKILEQLREMDREVAAFGLRKGSSGKPKAPNRKA